MEPISLCLLFSLHFVRFFSLRACVFPLLNGSQVSYMSSSTGAIQYGESYTPACFSLPFTHFITTFFLSVQGDFFCCHSVIYIILSCLLKNYFCCCCYPSPPMLLHKFSKSSERLPLALHVISFHLHTIACLINQPTRRFSKISHLFRISP